MYASAAGLALEMTPAVFLANRIEDSAHDIFCKVSLHRISV